MKPTNKLISAYYHAKREWISANDNYNKARFGITSDEYNTLRRIESSLFGLMAGSERMTVKQVKELLPFVGISI